MSEDKIEFSIKTFITMAMIFVFLGTMLGLVINEAFGVGDVEQLGSAICSEKYNSDFVKYSDGKVYCKEKEIEEKYDGIRVVLKDVPNE